MAISDSEDVYYIPRLTVRQVREIQLDIAALLTPVVGAGIDSKIEHDNAVVHAYAASDPESFEEIKGPDASVFQIFATLGSQLGNTLVLELQDKLLAGCKVSNSGKVSSDKISELEDYSIDTSYCVKTYYKILKVSFDQNAYNPFVECLNEMGFSEIVGSVQAVITQMFPATTD